MTPDELSERLLEFAAGMGRIVEMLPDTRLGRHIAGQLVRSGTSPAPNYEEACAAGSRSDFIHKLRICLKEFRESRVWLRLIIRAGLLPEKDVRPLLDECHQLCNIIRSIAGHRTNQRSKESVDPPGSDRSEQLSHPEIPIDNLQFAICNLQCLPGVERSLLMKLAYQVATPEVNTPDVTAHRGDLRAGMRLCAEAGFDGVELMMRDAAPNDAGAVAALAREHGLAIAMCCTGEVFGEDRLSFSDPDPAVREAALARARDILEFAGRLGVDINVGRLRGRLQPGVPRAVTLGWAREALLACAEHAAQLGIFVLLEPLPVGDGANFLNTTREAVAFVEGVGHPHFRLMLDIGHMAANGDDFAEGFRHAAPYNRYVHLTDDRRLPPGSGSVDFSAVLAALRASGYDGWVAVEVFQQPDSATAIRESARVLRPLVGR